MNNKIVLVYSMLLGLGLILMPPMQARKHVHPEKYTISDREVALERKINSAFAANQLTVQEADDLRGKLKKIKDKEQKMKDENGGRLTYPNSTTLEKSLNSISEKLQKKQLEKRVQ